MKAKNLVISAIICGASILGLNISTADAANNLQTTKINYDINIEQLDKQFTITYRDSDSNRYTGAERARRAIEGAERRERYEDYNRQRERERQERYERERWERQQRERWEREQRERQQRERLERERHERERWEREHHHRR